MGDRVSVAFRNGKGYDTKYNDSVVLFDHWGGKSTPQQALEYAKLVKDYADNREEKNCSGPLERMEPDTMMVGFICWLWQQGTARGHTYNKKVQYVETGFHNDSLYLAPDKHHGDNSDNGHWIIDLQTMKCKLDRSK